MPFVRQRLELADGDFLDLDWSRCGADRVVVLMHGLEGNTSRPYVQGMVRAVNAAGWDAVAVNFRGCSGTPNRLARSYHSGATEDLSAVTVSVPVHLADTAAALLKPRNLVYHQRFMRKLRAKVRAKATALPGTLDSGQLTRVRNIVEFDDVYTAPLHGFADAADYYARNSSLNWLPQIAVPTLLLTAGNDPILGRRCYPVVEAAASPSFHLEVTPWGGHVGFHLPGPQYYSERRTVAFLHEACDG